MIDEAKIEVWQLGLDPYDDFKDITENLESETIRFILNHDAFLEQLTSTYLSGSRYANDREVKILAVRILSSLMSGIDTNDYFKDMVSTYYDMFQQPVCFINI